MKTKMIFASVLAMTLAGCMSEPAINFGNDTSRWARDGECDDPRFIGPGADNILLREDLGRDATDCRMMYQRGLVRLR